MGINLQQSGGGSGGAGGLTLSTSGIGYFWGGMPLLGNSDSAIAWNSSSGNTLTAIQFVLPFTITINKITIGIGTGVSGSFVLVGIYDQNGNKVIDSGEFSGTTSSVVLSNTLSAGVTLPAGVYYFAWGWTGTGSSALTSANSFTATAATGSTWPSNPMNKNVTRVATAGNSISGGVMPSSLGTLTALSSLNAIPAVLFEV